MMDDIGTDDYEAWKRTPVNRASNFVNKFISARGNSDLDFISNPIRSNVANNIKRIMLNFLLQSQKNKKM